MRSSITLRRRAACIAVIVDVSGLSVAPHAFFGGALRVFPVGDVEDARDAQPVPGAVLSASGMRNCLPDAGNSPTDILALNISGKVVVHTNARRHAGLVNAIEADEVLTGGFNNLSAVSRYILDHRSVAGHAGAHSTRRERCGG